MEILIVGSLVVALMVYISTKIKRSAAEAFVPEIIEREGFTISKPQGFMSPLYADSGYEFEARTRDFGEKKTKNVWQAHVALVADAKSTFAAACERARKSADKIVSERTLKNDSGDGKVFLLESERKEDGVSLVEFRKIVESHARRKIYDLRIAVLPPFREIYIDRVNEMMDSFRIK